MHTQRNTRTTRLILLWFFMLIMLLMVACEAAPLDDTPALVDCPSDAMTQIIEDGWRFQLDPDDVGLDDGWYEAGYVTDGWQTLAPGIAWENATDTVDGVADYDGIAWYRTTVTLPDWDETYLVASRIDDRATIWINGEEAAQWQLAEARAGVLPLHDWAAHDEDIHVALRIVDDGVFGGVIDPVRLASSPTAGLTPEQWVATRADAHPGWPLPAWTQGGKLAWTMTGGINMEDESLVSIDGLLAPLPNAPTVEAWIYNGETNTLETGLGRIEFDLVGGNLPIPQWRWQTDNTLVQNTLLYDHQDDVLRWRLNIENSTNQRLLIVTRPLAINRTANPITAASMIDPSRLWINGQPFMVADQRPDNAGVADLEMMMAAALQGETPGEAQASCLPDGDGAALLTYALDAGTTEFNFAFSLDGETFPDMRVNFEERLATERTRWQEATTRTVYTLPDERIMESIPASVGYLLIANDPDGPHPGSLAHNAVWVRDAAYTGKALLQNGHADTTQGYMDAIFAGQEADGRVPPIQGEAVPWLDDEWDSQGQSIFLTVQYYRYTDDLETLEQWYPNIKSAAEFLGELLQINAEADDPAIHGILPPSLSAEDLGPGDHHYYWDNFWAIAGLEEAAFAATTLGFEEDAIWMQQTAEDLRAATLNSIEVVMGENPPYIPASIEVTTSAAMARGTVPALWPYRVLDPAQPLLERAFKHYFETWFEPNNGAYLHRAGQFWPYGGMGVAHGFLRLGMGGPLHTVLGWSLSNQTLPNTYAWAEQVNPRNGGFSGGDMPHAWAAGSWTTLIREMLVSEWDDRLHLFTGVPEWWFEGERVVGLENAPTHFGTLTLRTSGTLTTTENGWSGQLMLTLTGATPPDGFRWKLPYLPDSIEGSADATIEDGVLIIGGDGGEVILNYGP